MADKPKDNKPASEFGEVKVIKNEQEPAQTPQPGVREQAPKSAPGKTPEGAEG